MGTTYTNQKACGIFIDTIASVDKEDVVALIKSASYFSITMDGSTDISTTEQETLYVRTVCNGEITSKFLKIAEPESTTGRDLFKLVQSTVEELDLVEITNEKLVGFTCDGASNMVGRLQGAATLLKNVHPALVIIHCLAHRLELAYKDAIKRTSSQQYDKLVTLLVGLYYFYKRSAKQKKALKQCFEVSYKFK